MAGTVSDTGATASLVGHSERVAQRSADGEERLGPGDVFLTSKPDLPFSTHTMYTEGHSVTLSLSLLAEVAGSTAGLREDAPRFTNVYGVTPSETLAQ
jgi:hypothetical protein